MRPIDLRSDTVTRPTAAMRRAMAEAEVGDDVWGDDPTVIELERELAGMLGVEAALFVPSGTMGNQIAIRVQTRPGDELLVHPLAHIVLHEAGATAVLSAVQTRMVGGDRGMPGPEELARWVRDPADIHQARQSLICIENTVGEQGGLVYPQQRIDELAAFAHANGMRLHMDGARLWNAAAASGSDPARIVREIDSVSVCFSKGLGAPVGSAVAGSAELVESARRSRKLLGGGMRQAGIIAAGALHAIRHHVQRLGDDHANARRLAEGLAEGERMRCSPDRVETNIVFGEVSPGVSSAALVDEMATVGVLASTIDDRTVRFVTHLDVDGTAVEAAIERLRPMLG
jgi:threonine aldolase